MKDVKNNKTLDTSSAFLDSDFTNLDLNIDMEKIYKIIDNDELKKDFKDQINLTNLRDENYKRYNNINILNYKDLPNEFADISEDIVKFYSYINVKNILTDNYEDSKNNKVVLDNIYLRIFRLENMIKLYLKQLTKQNDEKQNKFSFVYFKNLQVDEKTKNELIRKYNDLVLNTSLIPRDIYEEIRIQEKRKQYINDILKLLNIGQENNSNLFIQDRLKTLNIVINLETQKYKEKIQYLEDLMPVNSKNIEEFNSFKEFFNKIIAYDDTNYQNARQTFEILTDETKIQPYINRFEEKFINERSIIKKEENFIYEKVGIKNLKNSLNYINANYIEILSEENKNIIQYIFNKLNSESYDLDELNKALKLVVRGIWSEQVTDVYSFNPNKDYYFICSNNQFIDEKYQTILITKKELDRVDDYEDYQIGFICGYNDNIMYITENDDIMTVNGDDDMSNLKTPLQLQEEFINFKVCNRIALNGYKTKIQAVYLINDGNMDKYMKAVELANLYKLPLIELNKDNH